MMLKFAKRSITRKDIIQYLKYSVGGSVYFVSGYIIFALLYSGAGWDWLPAKLVADGFGWTANYLIQRYWAFDSKGLQHHEGRTLGRFGLISVCNLALDYAIIAGLKTVGVSPYIGFFISSGFFTIWNYLWYRFWVFFVTNKKGK